VLDKSEKADPRAADGRRASRAVLAPPQPRCACDASPARRSSRAPAATITFHRAGAVVVGAVIVFPWLFTLWMSAFDWKIGSPRISSASSNYATARTNQRFLEAIVHTFYFTVLAVVVPLVLGPRRADLPPRVSVRGCCAASSSCR
jgi:hypothetical protein